MATRALANQAKPVRTWISARHRTAVIRERRPERSRVVARIALKASVDEMVGTLALGVRTVVTIAASSNDLRVIHSQRR